MAIDYRVNAPITAQQLSDVFCSSGLNRPVDDLPRLQRMIEGAGVIASAWDSDRLVGVARTMTDFAFSAYLSDLAVCAEYQRGRIGKELIARTRAHLGDQVMLLLLATPEANDYYPRIGFEHMPRAWWIPRKF
jgi:GNAT superfamily N-acetyltransferase